jgi:2-hydroxychromene-2-carboxylate isomerase
VTVTPDPTPYANPTLYFDLGSPYAYLATERASGLLGVEPNLEPVLLGAIFRLRGSGSWARTESRALNIEEIERRAARYGLPPLRWPAGWPGDGLAAMRAAVWARREGAIDRFTREVFRAEFVDGEEISDLDLLAECARRAGLDPIAMRSAIEDPSIKEELRDGTDRAWRDGVRGVPSLRVGETIFYGDDRMELAAAALGDGASPSA